MWYNKMSDTFANPVNLTFNKFTENFESIFFPFDTKVTACHKLFKLSQKSFYCLDEVIDEDFQKYIADFQNLFFHTGITDDITLIDQFIFGLDQQFATMILSMTTIPTTVKEWIEKAKTFHA